MPRAALLFVRFVDGLNYRIGRSAMYLLLVLMGILAWSAISTGLKQPSLWTLEMAQFTMVAYYILGGPYAMQMGDQVRMDLFYANWSPQRRAMTDAITALCLFIYLGVMIWGAVESLSYSLGLRWPSPDAPGGFLGLHWPSIGRLERSPTAWRPYLWPIKVVLLIGFALMFLQTLAFLIRDLAVLRGKPIPERKI